MNQLMMILTQREIFLLIIGSITYIALFVVTVQNSRRKMVAMHEKIRTMQEAQQAQSTQSIAQNEASNTCTAGEGIVADAGHRVGDFCLGQARAIGKRTVADGGEGAGEDDSRDSFTTVEG